MSSFMFFIFVRRFALSSIVFFVFSSSPTFPHFLMLFYCLLARKTDSLNTLLWRLWGCYFTFIILLDNYCSDLGYLTWSLGSSLGWALSCSTFSSWYSSKFINSSQDPPKTLLFLRFLRTSDHVFQLDSDLFPRHP